SLGNGGGISNQSGATCNISDSTQITFNKTLAGNSQGGGVWNAGTFTMTGGSLSNNNAGDAGMMVYTGLGGGIYNGGDNATATLSSVTLAQNNASTGGGFYLDSGSLQANQCYFDRNTADIGDGGFVNN